MTLEHTIDGKPLHFSFSDLSLRRFARKKGISNLKSTKIAEMMSDLSIDDIDLLFWCGLKEGAVKTGHTFDMSVEELAEYVDDHPDLYEELLQSLNEQTPEADPGNVKAGKA